MKIFYEKLTQKGLKVWWDIKCLEFGKPWEEGFIDGLFKSRVFVPILSREAFVGKNNNLLSLTNKSPVDNVLLEYRLAAELQKYQMIELVCPIMIGDYDNPSKSYTNYFKSGSHPDLKSMIEVVVNSIENRVVEVLDSQSLGMPLINSPSVKDIIDNITKNQGCFIEGDGEKSIDQGMDKIFDAIKTLSNTSESDGCDNNQKPKSVRKSFLSNDNKGSKVTLKTVDFKSSDALMNKLSCIIESEELYEVIVKTKSTSTSLTISDDRYISNLKHNNEHSDDEKSCDDNIISMDTNKLIGSNDSAIKSPIALNSSKFEDIHDDTTDSLFNSFGVSPNDIVLKINKSVKRKRLIEKKRRI